MQRQHRLAPLIATLVLAICAALPSAASAARIAQVHTSANTVMVFERNTDTGALRYTNWNSSADSWSTWTEFTDQVAANSDLVAISRASGSVDVFWIGTDQTLKRKTWSSTSGWAAAVTMNAGPLNGGPSIIKTASSTYTLFVRRASDGKLQKTLWQPSSNVVSTTTTDLVVAPWTTLGAYSYDRSHAAVMAITHNNSTNADETLVGAIISTNPWPSSFAAALPVVQATGAATTTPTVFPDGPSTGTSGTVGAFTPSTSGRLYLRTADSTGSGWAGATPNVWVGSSVTTPPSIAENWADNGPDHAMEWLMPGSDAATLQSFRSLSWVKVRPGEAAEPATGGVANYNPGHLRYFGRSDNSTDWDAFFQQSGTPLANQTWMRSHVFRQHTFTPHADNNTTWEPGLMVYKALYTVQGEDLSWVQSCHPDWIMRDINGGVLHVADGGNAGSTGTTSVAGNIYNAAYVEWQAKKIADAVNQPSNPGHAYRGVWLDNVNLMVTKSGLTRPVPPYTWSLDPYRVGAATGPGTGGNRYAVPFVAPVGTADPQNPTCSKIASNTQPTNASWATQIGAMVAAVRTKLPDAEILTNMPWMSLVENTESNWFDNIPAGGAKTDLTAPALQVVQNTNYVNLEGSGWFNTQFSGPDNGGTGPSGNYSSLETMLRTLDSVHAAKPSAGIVWDDTTDQATGAIPTASQWVKAAGTVGARVREYDIATHLLTQASNDAIGDYNRMPSNWPTDSSGAPLYEREYGLPTTLGVGTPVLPTDTTGRGVLAVNPLGGNRVWTRELKLSSGANLYVFSSEPMKYANAGRDTVTPSDSSYPDAGKGYSDYLVNWTMPTGCTNMMRSTQPSYATYNPSTGAASIAPLAAMFIKCPPGVGP